MIRTMWGGLIKRLNLSNFQTSGFNFNEAEIYLQFRFRTLNSFMAIALFFGVLIGVLAEIGIMNIGVTQARANMAYSLFNAFLIWLLRQDKRWFVRVT